MHVVRRTTTFLAAALLGAGLLGTPAAPAAGAPSVELEPARLTRGPDIAVPHVEGDDFVDGGRRVDLPGARAYLLGRSGDAHLVGTTSEDGLRQRRVLRVEADGSLTTVLTGLSPHELVLSEDGRRLVSVSHRSRRSSKVSLWSTMTGDLLERRSFRDYPQVTAAKGGRVLLSTAERGTFWWSPRSDRTRTVTPRAASRASITHDLLASYTGDPYQGGCTVVSRLSDPTRTLWTSCTERVDTFSPDGTRMATIGLLSDGMGPGRMVQRELDGTALATYRTHWFGSFSWESRTTMLLETHGRRRSATVRCELGDCENATDPERTVEPRRVLRAS